VEEGTVNGGFGSLVSSFYLENNYAIPIKKLGAPDEFIEQGTVPQLHSIAGIDSLSLIRFLNSI
jgi:1-deoxy-D-xylulose-5-phosphate synthase